MTTPTQGGTTRDGVRAARVLGHLALYYRPGCEGAARTLLTDLGCELVDNGPRPGEDGFASALLDPSTADHHDNVVYVAGMGDARTVGRIGGKALGWFLMASLASLAIGLVFANLFQPGANVGVPLPDKV